MTMNRALSWIPRFLSSKTSIIIAIVMFCYLVVLGAIATLTGHPTWVPDNAQLILGNYTNVLSMLGAGIAAGAGHKAIEGQRKVRELHAQTHDMLTQISEQLDTTPPDAK
ncbi:hypothetical protein QNM97_13795 [Gordonia sp. L191]|uniref:hypothetical protein n=1 Tax=Gordonia sp. L191 TaxID=2982699 RepID=UPI0024C04898|nr:hypothetical protein [Gordonia sp. L191]WHU45124.1 hypothetical protein QNM97_13795 [Gordonia sp. L191]